MEENAANARKIIRLGATNASTHSMVSNSTTRQAIYYYTMQTAIRT